jgi:hypothetical protein
VRPGIDSIRRKLVITRQIGQQGLKQISEHSWRLSAGLQRFPKSGLLSDDNNSKGFGILQVDDDFQLRIRFQSKTILKMGRVQGLGIAAFRS